MKFKETTIGGVKIIEDPHCPPGMAYVFQPKNMKYRVWYRCFNHLWTHSFGYEYGPETSWMFPPLKPCPRCGEMCSKDPNDKFHGKPRLHPIIPLLITTPLWFACLIWLTYVIAQRIW